MSSLSIIVPLYNKEAQIQYTLESINNKCNELNLKYGIPKNPKYRDIIINELLFNPEEGGSDFIEVYNNSSNPFDLSRLAFSKKTNETEFEEPFQLKKNPF